MVHIRKTIKVGENITWVQPKKKATVSTVILRFLEYQVTLGNIQGKVCIMEARQQQAMKYVKGKVLRDSTLCLASPPPWHQEWSEENKKWGSGRVGTNPADACC